MLRDSNRGTVLAAQTETFKTAVERSRGMLKFSSAPRSYAAIFEMPFNGFLPAIHTFGMKFPIDVFYCDKNKKICWAQKNVQPNRFLLPLRFALGGLKYLVETSEAETSQTQIGDQWEWA